MRTLEVIDADIKINNTRTAALHVGFLGRPHTAEEAAELRALDAQHAALHMERLDAPLASEAPAAAGLTSDDAAWSAETVEYVRAYCPLSRVAARTLDAFAARGAVISHASAAPCNLTLTGNRTQAGVRWTVSGQIGADLFDAEITVWAGKRGAFGQWLATTAAVKALGGVVDASEPSVQLTQALAA